MKVGIPKHPHDNQTASICLRPARASSKFQSNCNPMTPWMFTCLSPVLKVLLNIEIPLLAKLPQQIHQWDFFWIRRSTYRTNEGPESGLHLRCACTPKARTRKRHRENGTLKPVNGTHWQQHPCVALATWQDRHFEADFIPDIMCAECEPRSP